ncbi:aminotransferase class I/II-fold pyridoxal phosphate-dependent enzyme [Solirubrobacter ginsenosidimutans]|uniref:Aminotransferase class I/II-fold pyridoxal phosphate-dependent enzyme n=1 Tax=Solirubrobacter ginsenosidimutans TaxID=490573 RepID=A0A9X3MPQ1_9ACTN|nr:aminotransferase class I/II-fold pyridoxal phosphate-dependent enzyme [Solirubrobacter ginsenosidimutans]MDA0160399.1 aminotransferase class I/II-fold pyridoxal phosphate-dependent enzyme [Solirubrobacter ginsenosidimutans]
MNAVSSIGGTTAAGIAASVRDLVDVGRLGAGDALPPIRSLSQELGVNRNTVAAAYRLLVAAGVAETHGRGGTVIAAVPDAARDGASARPGLVDLASGNPDPRLLPDVVEYVRGYEASLYGTPAEHAGLAAWARGALGEELPGPFGVVVTHGAVDAIERLLAMHLTRGDAVAVEDPCFLAHISTLRLNGFTAIPVAVDQCGMSARGLSDALEAGARAVICTPRAQNPTGASLKAERAEALRAVLVRHPHALVIEDDHLWALSTAGYHRITPPELPRWALVRSVAKFLGPDLRLAVVAADEETVDRLHARLGPATTWVSHLLQHAVAGMLDDPRVERLRQTARAAYAARATSLVDALRRRSIEVSIAPDGLNVWIETAATADALAARGWRVRPANAFAVGATIDAVRVTTSTLTEQQAEAFAADLQEAACSQA